MSSGNCQEKEGNEDKQSKTRERTKAPPAKQAAPAPGRAHQIFACPSPRRPANTAAYSSARTAPGPTVAPMACNTGTCEKPSNPKPATVVRLANASDARVCGDTPALSSLWLLSLRTKNSA